MGALAIDTPNRGALGSWSSLILIHLTQLEHQLLAQGSNRAHLMIGALCEAQIPDPTSSAVPSHIFQMLSYCTAVSSKGLIASNSRMSCAQKRIRQRS